MITINVNGDNYFGCVPVADNGFRGQIIIFIDKVISANDGSVGGAIDAAADGTHTIHWNVVLYSLPSVLLRL